jgi:hypothetical protein
MKSPSAGLHQTPSEASSCGAFTTNSGSKFTPTMHRKRVRLRRERCHTRAEVAAARKYADRGSFRIVLQ